MSNINKSMDPYTDEAQNNRLTPQEKIDGAYALIVGYDLGPDLTFISTLFNRP